MPRNVNGELFFTVINKELNPEMRDTLLGNGQGGHFGWPFFKFQKNLKSFKTRPSFNSFLLDESLVSSQYDK